MKKAAFLTGVSAATLLCLSTSHAQYTAAEATTTISAAETVNQSQQAPARDPRYTARYGNAGTRQTPAPTPPKAAQAPGGRATQLAAPAAQTQPPQQPQAPARDPRYTARYGNAGGGPASQARTQQAPPQAAAAAQPTPAAPVYVIPVRAPDPEREQRIVDFQRQKAISGNPTSQYDLGMRYLKGDGVQKDRKQALTWLRMAEQGGNSRAKKQLQLLAKEPAPEKEAAVEAVKSE